MIQSPATNSLCSPVALFWWDSISIISGMTKWKNQNIFLEKVIILSSLHFGFYDSLLFLQLNHLLCYFLAVTLQRLCLLLDILYFSWFFIKFVSYLNSICIARYQFFMMKVNQHITKYRFLRDRNVFNNFKNIINTECFTLIAEGQVVNRVKVFF